MPRKLKNKFTTKEWLCIIITFLIAGFAILVGSGIITIGETGIKIVR